MQEKKARKKPEEGREDMTRQCTRTYEPGERVLLRVLEKKHKFDKFQVNNYRKQVEMDDAAAIEFGSAYLRRKAMHWWWALENKWGWSSETGAKRPFKAAEDPWNEFCFAVKKEFKPVNMQQIAQEELTALRQRTSVTEYISRFVNWTTKFGAWTWRSAWISS